MNLATVPEFPFMDTLWREKQSNSIELIRMAANSGPVCVYHSGGKDSIVIEELTRMAGVPHRSIYHVTTIDPPELVKFVRTCNVEMSHPGTNFIKLVELRGLPTRWRRWCCKELKHTRRETGVGIVGVRADESPARKAKWKHVQPVDEGWIVCPTLTWSEQDVWRFITERSMAYCCLYDQGWTRIGCIGCPLTGCPRRTLDGWPRMKTLIHAAWLRYCEKHTVDDPERGWIGWLDSGKLYGEAPPEDEDDCQMQYLFV